MTPQGHWLTGSDHAPCLRSSGRTTSSRPMRRSADDCGAATQVGGHGEGPPPRGRCAGGRMIAAQRLVSMVLWGPPGCGKTTIARLLAEESDLAFEPLSATFAGVADLRKIFQAAQGRREIGQGT